MGGWWGNDGREGERVRSSPGKETHWGKPEGSMWHDRWSVSIMVWHALHHFASAPYEWPLKRTFKMEHTISLLQTPKTLFNDESWNCCVVEVCAVWAPHVFHLLSWHLKGRSHKSLLGYWNDNYGSFHSYWIVNIVHVDIQVPQETFFSFFSLPSSWSPVYFNSNSNLHVVWNLDTEWDKEAIRLDIWSYRADTVR